MAESHRDSDRYGYVGAAQAAWFAHQLRPFEQSGMLRIGAVFLPPAPAGGGPADQAVDESTVPRDTTAFDRLVAGRLNLLLPGLRSPGTGTGSSTPGVLSGLMTEASP